MEDVLIGSAGRACMDSANEVKPHPNTGTPQSAANRVNNIGENRAYIPADVVKGFVSSHSIENYTWIFTREKGVNGYVTPRE